MQDNSVKLVLIEKSTKFVLLLVSVSQYRSFMPIIPNVIVTVIDIAFSRCLVADIVSRGLLLVKNWCDFGELEFTFLDCLYVRTPIRST